jgi:uncharacterized DUF497 family protein
MEITRAYWGWGNTHIDVTDVLKRELDKNPIVEVRSGVLGDPVKGRRKVLRVQIGNVWLTSLEYSSFSWDRKKVVKMKLKKHGIKQKEVHDFVDSITDDNIDCQTDHVVLTIFDNTNKKAIIVSKSDRYAGLYCFVAYYLRKIVDVENMYEYALCGIYGKDGFTVYKDSDDDDIYKILFTQDSSATVAINKYFAPSDVSKNRTEELKSKYKLNPKDIIGVYYRGTDKVREISLPDVNKYFKILDKIPDQPIFLQTDQQQILDAFKDRYGERVIYFDELPFSSTQESTYHKQTENRVKNAIEFNSALRILSECKLLLMTGNSNVSAYLWGIRDPLLIKTSTHSIY